MNAIEQERRIHSGSDRRHGRSQLCAQDGHAGQRAWRSAAWRSPPAIRTLSIVVDNAEFAIGGASWQAIGAEICTHPDFPRQTNVEFVRIVSPAEIEIRIFERGVGPTTSSGTGSSAAATAAIALNGCQSPLTVVAPGGAQTVAWSGPGTELHLTGPASLIARGEAWYA